MPHFRHGSVRPVRKNEGMVRSTKEWYFRGALAIGVLALAYWSITATLANVVVEVDPRSAYALNSSDGRITAAFAQQKFTATPETDPGSEPVRLSLQALRLDPTSVEALTVLGLQAQLQGDDARSDRLFGYSVWLSRRELQPQIWAIERAVGQGNINQALMNYDTALRTSVKAREILFPILSSAIAEPKVRSALIPILAPNPTWAQSFIQYAAVQSPEPSAIVDLFQRASEKGFPVDGDAKARLVINLATQNQMQKAWDYFATFRPGVRPDFSRDPNFTLDTRFRTPFDWITGSTPGLSVAFLRGEGKGIADFAVAPSTGATVMSQVQMLPAGSYRLVGRSRGIDQPDRSRPYWSLSCRAGEELLRLELQNSGEQGLDFSGQFVVPPGCPIQNLSLILRASDSISGVSGQIENAQLEPIQS